MVCVRVAFLEQVSASKALNKHESRIFSGMLFLRMAFHSFKSAGNELLSAHCAMHRLFIWVQLFCVIRRDKPDRGARHEKRISVSLGDRKTGGWLPSGSLTTRNDACPSLSLADPHPLASTFVFGDALRVSQLAHEGAARNCYKYQGALSSSADSEAGWQIKRRAPTLVSKPFPL